MKPSSLLLAFTAGATAYSIVGRDVKTVNTVLSSVKGGIDGLNNAINAFNGDPRASISAHGKLIAVINSGTSTIARSGDLTFNDAVALAPQVDDLTKHAKTLANSLKAKKPALEKARLCATTRKQAGDIGSASKKLTDILVSKVPKDVRSIAAGLAADLNKVLKEAQDAFASDKCKDR